MATKSFTTDYKFNKKSAEKVVKAMERKGKVHRANVKSVKITDREHIRSILGDTNK